MRFTDVIRHVSAPVPERLGRALRAVLDGLVLHLGIELGRRNTSRVTQRHFASFRLGP